MGLHSPGAVLAVDGRIRFAGRASDLNGADVPSDVHEIDAGSGVIVPGFVDAHSHPLFAGNREPDFSARLHGKEAPLGMLYTVQETRRALESRSGTESLWEAVRARMQAMLRHGTTTLEVKTGYALHKDGEVALLDIIHEHREDYDVPYLIATVLGPHTLPPEYVNQEVFVEYLIGHLLPVAKAHGALYADAFCETGFFSPELARRYLLAARDCGLRLRCHCDEMAYSGAAHMAAELHVDAIDHANCITPEDVRVIAQREIVTVACPATIAYLNLPGRAPVRALLEAGGDVALASDYNPGTSPCFNLQTVAYFGRAFFGLSAAEALYGVTRAAARSLRADAGKLTPGAPADLVVLHIESPQEFGWQFGGNLARTVVHAGRVYE